MEERHNWLHQPKVGPPHAKDQIISMQKIYSINWFLPEMLVIENSAIWFDEGKNCSHLTKNSSLGYYLHLMTNFMQKSEVITSFHRYWWPKNSTIWLYQRQNWPHPTINSSLKILPTLDDYLKKKLRYWLIPSWDIEDKIILQFDWLRSHNRKTWFFSPFFHIIFEQP